MVKIDILYLLCFLGIIFVYLISQFSFVNGKPTCNNYIINTYLYLGLSLLLLGYFSNVINYSSLGFSTLLFGILALIVVIAIGFQKNFQETLGEVIMSHSLWLLFIILISTTFSMYFDKKLPFFKYIVSTALIVTLIFVIMSMIVYLYPSFFISTYGVAMAGLLCGLLVIIISHIFLIFFGGKDTMKYLNILSYFGIVIFSLLVSYDTTKVIMLKEKCENYPNYPKRSIDFFLDIINLFSDVIRLRSR